MPFRLATDPAHTDRVNEDFAAVGADVAVLLDGAGTPAGFESGCVHGVAWYTRRLGGLLLAEATPDRTLADALASAIDTAAALHGPACDLADPNTPSATVAAVRFTPDRLDYLVLADSVLVVDLVDSDPLVVTDDRINAAEQEVRRLHPAGEKLTRREFDAGLARYRNVPGGFWTAGADPRAAGEALTGSVPLAGVAGLALLTDGASRLVDTFGLLDWRALLDLLHTQGPQALIARVRDAERADPDGRRWPRSKRHDDATVITWRPAN